MRVALLGYLCLMITGLAHAQQGALAGRVTNKKTREAVIGATVLVTGTTLAAPVHVDGSYELKLAPGTYSITMTYVGYKALVTPGVAINANQTTTLNGAMAESQTSLSEVTVTAVKQTGGEAVVLQDMKKSEVVVSGISSEQIVKSLDRDAAEVVKRIPGVTVQANNFIVIRGLAERYNTVLLNDALTPSAEVDTRSFSFDILPSSVIDRVLIFKSGAPELPGEFGGGVVKVYTKNAVLENATSLSVSGWARSTNTFKGSYLGTERSGTDFLGFDDGQRALADGLAALNRTDNANRQPTAEGLSSLKQNGALRNEFLPRLSTSRPDLRVSLGLNRKYEIGGVYLSNVTSVSYSSTQEQYESVRQRYTAYDANRPEKVPGLAFDYLDTRSVAAVRLGIIHNYQARLNERNRLEFRNFFNQYGTDEVVNRRGRNLGDQQERNDYALHYQSRSIYSGQLGGTHALGAAGRTTLTWAGGYNYVSRNEPDYRLNQQSRLLDDDYHVIPNNPEPFRVTVNQNIVNSNARFFSSLKEDTYMSSGQVEHRLLNRRDTASANQLKLRAGYYVEEKKRTYESRFFNYVPAGRNGLPEFIASQPLTPIFGSQNLGLVTDPATGAAVPGLTLQEGTNPQDRYVGKNRLVAGYLSAVLPVGERLSLSGGLRMEYNRKQLESGNASKKPYEEVRTFALPSANATFNFNERSLLRAGAGISVNRPEFREVANYTYYDVANNFFIQGNDSLRTAKIYSADLRYEFYPSRSELLSVGVFGKRFTDAIEQVTLSTTGNDLYLNYQNATRAYDLGAEVEARKSLRELSENAFVQRFSLVLNASFIYSRVQLDTLLPANRKFALPDRPLQGQSPYVLNAGLFYQDTDHRWQVAAQYNVIGPRIAFVGDRNQNYSIFEMPRHVVDLSVTKGVGEHLEIRAGVQNLLNAEVQQYYDFDRNGRINGIEEGKAFARYKRGVYSTFGLTYRF